MEAIQCQMTNPRLPLISPLVVAGLGNELVYRARPSLVRAQYIPEVGGGGGGGGESEGKSERGSSTSY